MDSPRAIGPATVTAEARFASGDNDIQLSGTVKRQVVLCAATVADDMTFQIVPTSPTNLPHNPRSSSRSSASAALRHGSSITGVLADLHAAPALATAGWPPPSHSVTRHSSVHSWVRVFPSSLAFAASSFCNPLSRNGARVSFSSVNGIIGHVFFVPPSTWTRLNQSDQNADNHSGYEQSE